MFHYLVLFSARLLKSTDICKCETFQKMNIRKVLFQKSQKINVDGILLYNNVVISEKTEKEKPRSIFAHLHGDAKVAYHSFFMS